MNAISKLARRLSVAAVLGFVAGCGGAPSAAEHPTSPAKGSEPVHQASVVDLSPVPEPKDVFAIGRWNNPKQFADTVGNWFNVPVPISILVDEIFDIPGASAAVDMQAPVELVMSMGLDRSKSPEAAIGVSVGFRSMEQGIAVFEQNKSIKEFLPGVYSVQIGTGFESQPCVLAPSAGRSAARLVCGREQSHVESLWRYMTATLPTAKLSDSAIYLQLRIGALWDSGFGQLVPFMLEEVTSELAHELAPGDNKELGRAYGELISTGGVELTSFLKDIGVVSVDLRMDEEAMQVALEGVATFRGKSSWLTQQVFSSEAVAGQAPEAFWRAPKSSVQAFFSRKAASNDGIGLVRKHVLSILDGYLSKVNLPQAERKMASDLTSRLLQSTGNSVMFCGTEGAVADDPVHKFQNGCSWNVVGFGYDGQEPREVWKGYDDWMKDLVRLYNRPSVRKVLMDETGVAAKYLPKVAYETKRSAELPGLKRLTVNVPVEFFQAFDDKDSDSGQTKPKAKKLLDDDMRGPIAIKRWKPSKPMELKLLLWQDGTQMWVVTGTDEALLETQLKTIKKGGEGTIAGHPELRRFTSAKLSAGGFMTVAGLANRIGIGGARVKGMSPIFFEFQASSVNPAVANVRLEAGQGAIQELQSLVSAVGVRGRP